MTAKQKSKKSEPDNRSKLERDISAATKGTRLKDWDIRSLMEDMSSMEETTHVTFRSFPACNSDM